MVAVLDPARLAREGVLDLPVYVPGKPIEEVQRELGLTDIIKMASNESPLGPSPRAVAALAQALGSIHVYPEGPATELRQVLARRYDLAPGMVLLSNGGDNVITLLALALLNPGEEALTCGPTFTAYEHAVKVAGGRFREIPLREGRFDLPALAAAITPRTKLVFICNPNNPTGTMVGRRVMDTFIDRLPDHAVVMIDEAYGEYADDAEDPDTLRYVREGRSVLVLRTFSKIYGLAGLRLGYGLAPAGLIGLLERVREPFPVNRLAQVAGLAALEDAEHVARALEVNRAGRELLYRELAARGLGYMPTQANFLFIDLRQDARPLCQSLLGQGVIVRPGAIWGYDDWIRLTIGREEDNRRFLAALDRSLAGAAAR